MAVVQHALGLKTGTHRPRPVGLGLLETAPMRGALQAHVAASPATVNDDHRRPARSTWTRSNTSATGGSDEFRIDLETAGTLFLSAETARHAMYFLRHYVDVIVGDGPHSGVLCA